jgi:hypothetical protein
MLWRLFTVNVDPMSTNDHFGRPLYWWQVVVLVGGCVAKLEEATQQFKRNIFDFIPFFLSFENHQLCFTPKRSQAQIEVGDVPFLFLLFAPKTKNHTPAL